MRAKNLLIVLVGLLIAAGANAVARADAKDDAVKKEQAKLKGKWTLVSIERDGKPVELAADQGVPQTLTFDGDQMTATHGERTMKAAIKLDPTQKPKAIDLSPSEPPEAKGRTLQGLYELEGDTLKICLDEAGGARPKEFSSKKEGARMAIVVFKRAK